GRRAGAHRRDDAARAHRDAGRHRPGGTLPRLCALRHRADPRGGRRALNLSLGINMAWIWLTAAGLLEVVWAIALKYTAGFTRIVPSMISIAGMVASVYCLAIAVRTIPIGTGYAVWTGIGAVGVSILGMILFDEPATLMRLGSILLIIAGIAGLKLVT